MVLSMSLSHFLIHWFQRALASSFELRLYVLPTFQGAMDFVIHKSESKCKCLFILYVLYCYAIATNNMDFIKQKLNLGAFGMVITGMVIAGTNVVALKFATNSMEPLVYAGVRALAVGIILFLFVGNYKRILSLKMLTRLMPSVLLLVAFLSMHAIGVSQSGALKASILSLTIPVLVYFFAVTLLHEPLIKRIFFGGLLTLLGSIMLIGIPVVFGKPLVASDILILLAYACLAGAVVHGKYMFKWLTPNELLSARFTIGGILLVGYVLFFMEPSAFLVGSGEAWLVLLYAIIISGIISNTLYYRGLAKLKAEQTAPLYYLDPMTGTLLATLLLSEKLDITAGIGVAVIVLGVAIAYPHHHHIMHNYLHPQPHRLKRLLRKLLHPKKR